MRVLILRPEPGNAATAAAVAAMGLEPIACPLFDIAPVDWTPPDTERFDAVVMTSANAARHGGAGLAKLAHLECLAVGEATAVAARRIGFAHVTAGKGDAAALASDLLLSRTGEGRVVPRLLHLTGVDHRPLALVGTVAIAVYVARALELALPPADIALVHSPRAGARLAALASDRSLRIVAISAAAAAACGPGWTRIVIADAPNEHAMLASLAQACEAGGDAG